MGGRLAEKVGAVRQPRRLPQQPATARFQRLRLGRERRDRNLAQTSGEERQIVGPAEGSGGQARHLDGRRGVGEGVRSQKERRDRPFLEASGANFGFQGLKWQACAIVLGMSALIGLLAALVPALVAARKNVVESLRFTG